MNTISLEELQAAERALFEQEHDDDQYEMFPLSANGPWETVYGEHLLPAQEDDHSHMGVRAQITPHYCQLWQGNDLVELRPYQAERLLVLLDFWTTELELEEGTPE